MHDNSTSRQIASRTKLISARALIACGFVLLLGCESHPTAATDRVQIEAYVSKAELHVPGDSVLVRVVVTNTSRAPRTIPVVTCPAPFEVRTATGEAVSQDLQDCAAVARRRTLASGESVELTGSWRGEVRSAGDPETWGTAPAGSYRLFGRWLGTTLVSAPVNVQVLAGD